MWPSNVHGSCGRGVDEGLGIKVGSSQGEYGHSVVEMPRNYAVPPQMVLQKLQQMEVLGLQGQGYYGLGCREYSTVCKG